MIAQTTIASVTIVDLDVEQCDPESLESITLQSEAEMTVEERRTWYVAMFNPCGLA